MGWQALVSHASGKCHKTHFDRKQMFFKPKPARAAKPQSTNSSNVDSASTPKSDTIIVDNEPRIDLILQSSQKQKAEIVWAIKVVCSSYSNNSCFDVSQVFKCMFPDSEIAKSFELGADKLKYVINFGLAPYFEDMLGELLKKSDHHVISFDESLNDVTQNCQMDILVRFFDSIICKVKVRYLDSIFLGHSTHQDLYDQFSNAILKLDSNIEKRMNILNLLTLEVVGFIHYMVFLNME